MKHSRFMFGSPELEGVLTFPEEEALNTGYGAGNGVVLSHPHSKLGGDMRNNVVIALAERLAREGYLVLRFNFRGVGRSKSWSSWTGKAERSDVGSAADFLRKKLAEPPLLTAGDKNGNSNGAIANAASVDVSNIICQSSADVATNAAIAARIFFVGYSFGSAVGISCAELFDGCVAVSYPYGRLVGCVLGSHYSYASATPHIPKLFIIGDSDQFVGAAALQAFVDKLPGDNNTFELVPSVDHFWNGQEHKLFAPIVGFLASL